MKFELKESEEVDLILVSELQQGEWGIEECGDIWFCCEEGIHVCFTNAGGNTSVITYRSDEGQDDYQVRKIPKGSKIIITT